MVTLGEKRMIEKGHREASGMLVMFFIWMLVTRMCYFVKIHQVKCDMCIILSVLFVNKKPLEVYANYIQ